MKPPPRLDSLLSNKPLIGASTQAGHRGGMVEADKLKEIPESNLDSLLAILQKDYKRLAPRIRTLTHSITCEFDEITLRLHYPSFRDGACTVSDLVKTLGQYLVPFALPRAQINSVYAQRNELDEEDYRIVLHDLEQEALTLFKRAHEATNRNGEAGELLLYLLTEWILEAPQIFSKMHLKTNREMPVHGADGVHVKYCSSTHKLNIYWGESKLYTNVSQAIAAAAASILESLSDEKIEFELQLLKRNIDFSGLSQEAKTCLLRYLDPCEEESNERSNITTCLISFDFEAFKSLEGEKRDKIPLMFETAAKEKLKELAPVLASAIKEKGLQNQTMEFFFFPLPSVVDFRNLFQSKIGWKPAEQEKKTSKATESMGTKKSTGVKKVIK